MSMAKTDARRGYRGLSMMGAALLGVIASACRADSQPPEAAAVSSGPAEERVQIGGVLWYVDYDSALEVAREQDKALWVHFGENPG